MSGNQLNTSNTSASFTVNVAGTKITQAEPNGLQSLMVEDHVDMIGVCEMTFVGSRIDWGSLEIGADVDVTVGGSTRKLFVGFITGLRHRMSTGR
jgi:hypothetical protein